MHQRVDSCQISRVDLASLLFPTIRLGARRGEPMIEAGGPRKHIGFAAQSGGTCDEACARTA
jgi:hypothetical protein